MLMETACAAGAAAVQKSKFRTGTIVARIETALEKAAAEGGTVVGRNYIRNCTLKA